MPAATVHEVGLDEPRFYRDDDLAVIVHDPAARRVPEPLEHAIEHVWHARMPIRSLGPAVLLAGALITAVLAAVAGGLTSRLLCADLAVTFVMTARLMWTSELRLGPGGVVVRSVLHVQRINPGAIERFENDDMHIGIMRQPTVLLRLKRIGHIDLADIGVGADQLNRLLAQARRHAAPHTDDPAANRRPTPARA